MENTSNCTVKISGPKATGFSRVLIIEGDDEDTAQYGHVLDNDDEGATLALQFEE